MESPQARYERGLGMESRTTARQGLLPFHFQKTHHKAIYQPLKPVLNLLKSNDKAAICASFCLVE
jgi:hypothetical protein